jgi:hypothetical protein
MKLPSLPHGKHTGTPFFPTLGASCGGLRPGRSAEGEAGIAG